MSFVTLSQVKDYLDIPSGTTDHDDFLSGVAARVSGILEEYLDRQIEAGDVTDEVRDGDGSDTIYTRQWPVNSVSKVETRYTLSGSWSEVDSSDYEFDGDRGRIILKSGFFPAGERTVRLSYNAGYSAIPSALVQACLELTALVWLDSKKGEMRLGLSSLGAGEGGSQAFVQRKLPEMLLKAVNRYKRRAV